MGNGPAGGAAASLLARLSASQELLPEPPCSPEVLSMDLFIEFNATEECSMKKIFPFSLNVSWLSHF